MRRKAIGKAWEVFREIVGTSSDIYSKQQKNKGEYTKNALKGSLRRWPYVKKLPKEKS